MMECLDLGMQNGTGFWMILSQICWTLEEKEEVATFLLPHLDGALDAKRDINESLWILDWSG